MVADYSEFGFEVPLDRTGLSTKKWEIEQINKNDPSVLCFSTAEMDFRAAPAIQNAINRVAQSGHFGYPHKRDSYFEAIVSHFDRNHGWTIDPTSIYSHVAIYPSMQPFIEELTAPGDEIVFQSPVHHCFEEVIRANGRTPLANPLVVRDGQYVMDLDGLADIVTERTKMLILCNPHNPVGRAWTRDELEALNTFCLGRGIFVLTDEVYFGLVRAGRKYTPFASLSEEAAMNSATLISASKSYNLTGTKHSLVIIDNPEHRKAFEASQKKTNLYFGGCMFGQAATEAALRGGDSWRCALMEYIDGNFVLLRDTLNEALPGITVYDSDATYFAWLDMRGLGVSDEQIIRILDEARIAVTYGKPLGPGGAGHIRFNLATARITLQAGLDRFVTAFEKHLNND
ncbi:MalY/PatB family protein [Leisingera sp. ANG-DT]|uniref:MalY/PatB family protein n=1 Tax=Leisingera sp. ANG-DT TaxID=1577897 RepID=UPI00068E2184|nr:aminotransferase class I/II-fold pyridoxal phosphate-dependent enzyme [Leisingera sp. ANG-DT]